MATWNKQTPNPQVFTAVRDNGDTLEVDVSTGANGAQQRVDLIINGSAKGALLDIKDRAELKEMFQQIGELL